MGSNCCVSYNPNKDMSAENFITLHISRLQNSRRTTFQDIAFTFRSNFGIDPLDIEGSPLRWITKDAYDCYMLSLLNETQRSQIASYCLIDTPLKHLFLPYESTALHTYLPSYSLNFHLFLLTWLIGIVNFPLKEKVGLIKHIIIKMHKILTFSTFTSFLLTYLTLFLIEITQQFVNCPDISVKEDNGLLYLIENIYNTPNVEAYHNLFTGQMKLLIIKTKNIYINEKNIKNTFISEKELYAFFEEYPFLLNAQELRENFNEKFDASSSLDQVMRGNMCS